MCCCQILEFHQQLLPVFLILRIRVDALDRADHHALGFVEMADTFGAARGVNDVDVLALRDGLIRAGRFADIAVDAQRVDLEGHGRILRAGEAGRR